MSWFPEENAVFNTAIMVTDTSSHPSHLWNLKIILLIMSLSWSVSSPPSHCSTYSSLLREIQLCREQTEARWEGGESSIDTLIHREIVTLTWTYHWVSPHIWPLSPGPRTCTATLPVCSPLASNCSGFAWLPLSSDSTSYRIYLSQMLGISYKYIDQLNSSDLTFILIFLSFFQQLFQ